MRERWPSMPMKLDARIPAGFGSALEILQVRSRREDDRAPRENRHDPRSTLRRDCARWVAAAQPHSTLQTSGSL